MRMRILIITAVMASGAAAFAQQDPAGFVDKTNGLSLQQLIEQARANEPSLRAARLDVDAMEAEVRQAALRANPRVEIERRQVPGGMDRQTMAMAALPLELFRRGPRTAAARADVTVAAAMAEDRERMLLLDVRMAYNRYLAAIRRIAVLDELLTEARRTVSLLESRAAAGASPRLERDQAAIEASRVEADRLAAVGVAEAARAELQRAVGLQPGRPLAVRDRLEAAVIWPEIDAAVHGAAESSAVDTRADVRAALGQVDAQNARREQAKSEGRFDVSVFGGYMRMTSGFPQRGLGPDGEPVPIEGTFNNVVAGAMIDIPLFNRNQGRVAAAEIRAAAAQQTAEARRLAAAAEVEAAHARLRAAAARARIFTKPLRDTARQNVDVVREAYSLGRNTMLDVVIEQTRYLEVEMAYTEALMELLDAHAAWQAATGRQQ